MLEARNLSKRYNGQAALADLNLHIPPGEVFCLLGANGAGKTTALRACTGLLPIHRGTIRRGSISLEGRRIDGLGAPDIVQAGVAQVMEGRRVFAELTVEENLRVGSYTSRSRLHERLRQMFDLFPVLGERRGQRAGYLSGGEQQMLAIARALMSEPRYLLLDEPSLGLAPVMVKLIFDNLRRINAEGTTILLVEQNVRKALELSTRAYVLENGRMALSGSRESLLASEDIKQAYLGL
jgi:branched-chain amino acid transport system ATP-binding protein